MPWSRFVLAGCCAVGVLGLFSCNDSPTGPSNVNLSDLMGTWRIVESTESWDFTENGARDRGSETEEVFDSSEIVVITQDSVIWYDYYIGDDCHSRSAEAYALSGHNLLGSTFDGEESNGSESYTWHTTVSLSSDGLVVTMREAESFEDFDGWYQTAITHQRYTGAVPLAAWPTAVCADGTMYKRRTAKALPRKLPRG